jgi:hypothetical protein
MPHLRVCPFAESAFVGVQRPGQAAYLASIQVIHLHTEGVTLAHSSIFPTCPILRITCWLKSRDSRAVPLRDLGFKVRAHLTLILETSQSWLSKVRECAQNPQQSKKSLKIHVRLLGPEEKQQIRQDKEAQARGLHHEPWLQGGDKWP